MSVDFGVFPPEVNSGLMYAGPGAGSMLAAVAAWQRLAGELGSVASGYESVIAGLTGQGWSGPAAESMAAAAAPFVVWLSTTAAVAEQAAIRLGAAVGAFEEAYAAMVPPSVIEANRCQLASLIAGNVLGHNGAAIAATEAQYVQMWTQDAAVMSGYAVRSAAAATLTSFAEPPASASSAGLAGQATAVGQAAAGGTHTQLSQLINALPQASQGLGSTAGSPLPSADGVGALQSAQTPSLTQVASWLELGGKGFLPFNDANIMTIYGLAQYNRNLIIDMDIAVANKAASASITSVLPSAGLTGPAGAGSTAANIGDAGMIGKLSVPPSWAATMPEVELTAAPLPDTGSTAAPTTTAGGLSDLVGDMALAAVAGRAIGGATARGRRTRGTNGPLQNQLESVAAELTGAGKVQHWHAESGRLKSLLTELSQKPGVHTVHLNPDGQSKPDPPPQPSRG